MLYDALKIYRFILIASVIITWLPVDMYNPVCRFFRQATEPVLAPIRQVLRKTIPAIHERVDLSWLVALAVVEFLLRIIR